MLASPIPQADWQGQRVEWTSRFEQIVCNRVQWSLSDVNRNRGDITYIKKHFASLLTVLQNTHSRPNLHNLALALILALHPTPLYWGDWETWMREIEFAAQAAETLGQLKIQALMLAYQSQILMSLGHIEKGMCVARKSIDLALLQRAAVPLGIAGSEVVSAYRRQENNMRAAQFMEEIETHLNNLQLEVDENDYILAQSYIVLAKVPVLRRSGQVKDAIRLIDTVVDQIKTIVDIDQSRLASLYRKRATLYWASGNYQQATRDLVQTISLYQQEGAIYDEITARGDLGLVYWSKAELDKAEQSMQQAIKLADEFNARWRLTAEIGNMVAVYMSRGRLVEALQFLDQHEKLATQLGDVTELSRVIGNRGTVLLYLGKYQAALADLQTSYELFKDQGRAESVIASYIDLSYCYFGLGERERALQYAQKALKMARCSEFSTIRIIALRCIAEQTEDIEKRRAYLDEALALARAHERRLDEAGCLLSLCEITQEPGKKNRLWEEGKKLLEECGASAWLEGASPENPPFVIMVL